MLTLNVKGKKGVYDVKLPTSINEIEKSYIYDVTKHVKLDANYSLIGVIYREKLSTIVLASRKNKKASDVAVIPIFVKAGKTDSEFINNLNIKDKLIISPSDIMMGHHISAPNNLITINNILDIIDGDIDVYNEIMKHNEQCYFIEFKLVPNCNIHGSYENLEVASFVSPFVTKISDINEPKHIIITNNKIII